MKKFVAAMLLIATLTMVFAGCGKKTDDPSGSSDVSDNTTAPVSESGDPDKTVVTDPDSLGDDLYKERTVAFYNVPDAAKTQGRVILDRSGYTVSNSASGIEFNAKCSGKVTLNFRVSRVNNEPFGTTNDGFFFTVIVDGKQVDREKTYFSAAEGSFELTLAEDLAAGEHNFKVYRQTEAYAGIMVFKSITLTGVITKAPENKAKLIEFVGDSLTTGYGVYSESDVSMTTTATPVSFLYQDATLSYGYLAANALDTDFSLFCRSGIGVVSGSMPTMGTQISDISSWGEVKTYTPDRQADLVVVNLGTNDLKANCSADQLKGAMGSLIAKIRGFYPNAKIVWCYGMMYTEWNSELPAFIEEFGGASEGYYYVQLPSDMTGHFYHSSAAGQQAAADVLVKFIRDNNLL